MSSSNFIDYVKINARSGAGGAGSVHFRREKHVDKGGPDGGNGGRGGHVIMKGNAQLWTLLHLKYTKHVKAEAGKNGEGGRRSGTEGKDIFLEVPLGTVARDFETGEELAEITDDGQEIILLPGGQGGMGNDHFKSATRQTPDFAQPGGDSRESWIVMELKVLADVGLVGFPNAGKSTLLSVVSAARPEIAAYPFTTLVPNLGVVSYRDFRSFVMADIPGIIEGASEGRGLGLRFLRHIERNSLLLFMIPADSEDPGAEYETLLNELRQYNPSLLDKQRLIAVSKIDLVAPDERTNLLLPFPREVPTVLISAIAQEGIEQLKDLIWKTLNEPLAVG